jgi:hypothetical protein
MHIYLIVLVIFSSIGFKLTLDFIAFNSLYDVMF